MTNIISEIEERILNDESIIFDEEKIKEKVLNLILEKMNSIEEKKRPFYFENIISDFFKYLNLNFIETKKTRDFGLDGFLKLRLEVLGEVNLGVQIKYKLIDSTDIDLFSSALKNAEIQLGLIVCKDSRNLQKYNLNSKIKTILLSKGIEIKEKLIKEEIDLNPVLILKLNDIVEIITSNIRGFAKAVYKND